MNLFSQKIISTLLLSSLSFSSFALDIGKVAPEFSIKNIATQKLANLKHYQGKVIYVDFWASWCPPCRTSFPLLEKLAQDHKQNFQIIAINMDEEIEAMEAFLKKYPVSFDILRDPEGIWADTYGVESMPTSFIIDKKGIVRSIHSGFAKDDIHDIEKEIKHLLEEQ